MKFYTVYKTTNLINNKVYIGRHSTNNLNDGYIGSGVEFTKAVKEFGRKNFKHEILFVFDNWKEMVDKETELLTEEFVDSDETYNSTRQGKGLVTHTEEVRKIISQVNTGFLTAKDSDGNYYRISKSDPRYLNGELVHMFKNTISVKDKDGKIFKVDVDDPRRLSGELKPINSGIKQSEEQIRNRVEKNLVWWQENSHTEEGLERIRQANIGKVNVKDKDGNEFRVSKEDPRYLSGELVVAFKGSVWVHKDELQKSKCVRPEKLQQFLDDGWIKGLVYYNKKLLVWINNPTLNISKRIEYSKIDEYLNNGWFRGKKINVS